MSRQVGGSVEPPVVEFHVKALIHEGQHEQLMDEIQEQGGLPQRDQPRHPKPLHLGEVVEDRQQAERQPDDPDGGRSAGRPVVVQNVVTHEREPLRGLRPPVVHEEPRDAQNAYPGHASHVARPAALVGLLDEDLTGHQAEQHQGHPGPGGKLEEENPGGSRMGDDPPFEEHERPPEPKVDEHGSGHDQVASGDGPQQETDRRRDDDAEADRLQDAVRPERVLGEDEHVQEKTGQDDAAATLGVLPEGGEQLIGDGAASLDERERQAEADQEEERRRRHRHGHVDGVVPGPPHRAVLPPAARVVQDHEDEGETPHGIQEDQAIGGRRSGGRPRGSRLRRSRHVLGRRRHATSLLRLASWSSVRTSSRRDRRASRRAG